MSLLLKLRNWVRGYERKFEEQFRGEPPAPNELLSEILDHVEEKIALIRDDKRGFPFTLVTVYLLAPAPESQARYRASYEEDDYLATQIRHRLRERGTPPPAGLRVKLKFESERSSEWLHSWFDLECGATSISPGSGKSVPSSFLTARLTVLQGQANQERYDLDSPRRVAIGRMEEVLDAKGVPKRTNEVSFLDNDGEINRSVGREHAHLDFNTSASEWRLYADSHRSNTNIVRDGKTISVTAGSRRGEKLLHNDVIICGRARLLFELDWQEERE